jgi:hypothetical protein
VNKVHDRIVLSQDKYVGDLLKKTWMVMSKLVGTPLAIGEKLASYIGIVGALQYLTLTRPDIAFAVNKVCQFLHAPTDVH